VCTSTYHPGARCKSVWGVNYEKEKDKRQENVKNKNKI
jgi:hypothetical protein